MPKVPYDVTHLREHDWRNGGDPGEEVDPGSFAARLPAHRVDLVALVKDGIPPREYHSHSEGMLVKGKRHLWAAPHKSGKSLVALVHASRMATAGERIVILDRENGADEYADRLAQIMDAWDLGKAERAKLGQNLSYFEYPTLRRNDAAELVAYLHDELAADLVVFDSQRMFLTDYGLAEALADDYALFMSYAIDPLHRAGITTLILDNTGHADAKRARGSSSKGDLNEVLFHLKEVEKFDRQSRGIVELAVDYSRFGDRGGWRMAIGGGVFGEWESTAERGQKISLKKPELKPAVYEVLRASDGRPIGSGKLLGAVRAKKVEVRSADGRQLLKEWAADPAEPLRHVKDGYVVDQ